MMDVIISEESYNSFRSIPIELHREVANRLIFKVNSENKATVLEMTGMYNDELFKIKGFNRGLSLEDIFDLCETFIPFEMLSKEVAYAIYESEEEKISGCQGIVLSAGILKAKLHLDVYRECYRNFWRKPHHFILELVQKTHSWFTLYSRYLNQFSDGRTRKIENIVNKEGDVEISLDLIRNIENFSTLLRFLYGDMIHPLVPIEWEEVLRFMDNEVEGIFCIEKYMDNKKMMKRKFKSICCECIRVRF